jgi:hypothetical protein
VGAVVLVALGVVAALTGDGWGHKTLQDRIEAEVHSATGLDVVFELPDGHGQGARLYFLNREYQELSGRELWGRMGLSTPQTVAAITAFGSFLGEPGPLRDDYTLSLIFPYSGGQEVEWDRLGGASERHVRSVVGTDLPYGESYCAFPELRVLLHAGAGSDFGRVGECNPELEEFGISAWQDSTGRDGLAELGQLKTLSIEGGFDDPAAISSLQSLRTLRVELANDTPETREELRATLPNCDIEFV